MFGRGRKKPFVPAAQLATLIAQGVEIEGDVVFSEGMRIDGRIVGDVVGREAEGGRPSLLVLSSTGRIEGSVRCGDAVVNGVVTGDLDVLHRLELQAEARVTGTIRYRQLQMDVGAQVTGQLVRVPDADGAAPANVVELGAEKAANERR
jgi:cytoskeletal protein CcmA (bactofilin family)